jgi:hypothetical protein
MTTQSRQRNDDDALATSVAQRYASQAYKTRWHDDNIASAFESMHTQTP